MGSGKSRPRGAMAMPALALTVGVAGAFLAGCYGRADATKDANLAWQGQPRTILESEWGTPAEVIPDPNGDVLRYSFSSSRIKLPSASGVLVTGPGYVQGEASFQPGSVARIRTDVLVTLNPAQQILHVEGPSLRWGPPDYANLRWGLILGGHAGMSRLDDTGTPLPGGGLYIGGMLSSTLALVGTFSMAAGKGDGGGAMAFAWGFAPQRWVSSGVWIRGGPAMILAFNPGFEDAGLEPGVTAGASFAVIKAGSFTLDLRLDVSAGTSTTFGTAGVGVNLN